MTVIHSYLFFQPSMCEYNFRPYHLCEIGWLLHMETLTWLWDTTSPQNGVVFPCHADMKDHKALLVKFFLLSQSYIIAAIISKCHDLTRNAHGLDDWIRIKPNCCIVGNQSCQSLQNPALYDLWIFKLAWKCLVWRKIMLGDGKLKFMHFSDYGLD